MAAASTVSRANSRVNYSNEIHDLSTVQSGGSAVPTMYYPEKSLADIFPPHLLKKVTARLNSLLRPPALHPAAGREEIEHGSRPAMATDLIDMCAARAR